jgi:hypothetical protein
MVFSLENQLFPVETETQKFVEYIKIVDLNGYSWHIARVLNGFMLTFKGDAFFAPTNFSVEIKEDLHYIKNKNCFFFQNEDFEVFYDVVNTVKNNETDTVFDFIQGLLRYRLKIDDSLTESEL